MIFPVVLRECETWSLTFKEERKVKVFANRVLRSIFGSKRDKVRGEWRRLHNEELYDLFSTNIIYVIKWRGWAGNVARIRGRRGAYIVLVGIPEEKIPLGRSSIDGRIILKLIFKKLDGTQGLD
jgi:hypothetical protein